MQECRDGTDQPSDLPLAAEVRRTFAAAWHRKARLAGRLWPLAAVPAAFALFVLRNGGVVVGDRSAHAPVKHLMQPLYFLGFSVLAFDSSSAQTRQVTSQRTTVSSSCEPARLSASLAGSPLFAGVF